MGDYCHLVLAVKQELLWRVKEGRGAMSIIMHKEEKNIKIKTSCFKYRLQ